jgi:hypothetical protein
MNSVSRGRAVRIFYRTVIVFAVANILYWSIPTVGAISRFYKTSAIETWFRTIPPSYSRDEASWVKQHWIEINRAGDVYKSYVDWRHAPFQGETINVEGPYLQRRTVNNASAGDKKAFFFGGSTMWGLGATDAGTIPSQFAAVSGVHSENFADNGWNAHQSLMLLIQLIQAGQKPDLVVFYDGGNEVEKCRMELSVEGHEKEPEMDTVLHNSSRTDSFSHFLAPLVTLAQRLNDRLGLVETQRWYECDRNPQKAEAIAENLLRDWRLAKQLVEEYGGKFVGILEPVGYFSRTRIEGLRFSEYSRLQYAAVYPRIREKIARGGEFHDFVPIFDRDENIYVDCCHVSPKGNRYTAERIAQIVAPLGIGR